MLQVPFIRDHKEKVLVGLTKRNFKNAEVVIDQVIATDELKRSIQVKLDGVLAESNALNKEIGILFKSGEAQKANLLKERSGQLKISAKELQEQFSFHYRLNRC